MLTDILGTNGPRILDGLCAGQAPERILAGLTPHVRGKLGSLARNEAALAPYRRQLDLLETIPSIARVSAHALLAECAHGAARTKRSQFHGLHTTLKGRLGYKQSILAVTHKLLRVVHAVLRTNEP